MAASAVVPVVASAVALVAAWVAVPVAASAVVPVVASAVALVAASVAAPAAASRLSFRVRDGSVLVPN